MSFQISGPVVLKWMSGLAGFLNCCGMKYFASWAISSARATAPRIPSAAGVSTMVAPRPLSSCRRSMDIESGIKSVSG